MAAVFVLIVQKKIRYMYITCVLHISIKECVSYSSMVSWIYNYFLPGGLLDVSLARPPLPPPDPINSLLMVPSPQTCPYSPATLQFLYTPIIDLMKKNNKHKKLVKTKLPVIFCVMLLFEQRPSEIALSFLHKRPSLVSYPVVPNPAPPPG